MCASKPPCPAMPLPHSWRYGEVSGNPRWKGLSWGMLPCLGSAMCACTWHFFYNSPELQVLLRFCLRLGGAHACVM